MLTGVSAEAVAKSGRKRKSVTIQTVQCGCGANLSRELMVEPTADKDCTRVKLRRPHELRGSGLERYPLRARFRRTSEGSEIHMHWRLTYMPRRKRSRLSEFHLLFMTTATRKSRRGQENTQCFRVSGLRQVCKRKVTCKVRYPKKRARGLSLQVLYRYRKGQKVRGQKSTKVKGERSPGFSYVLKSSLTRRTKRRETRRGKSGSPQKKKNKPRRRMLTLYRLRQTSQEDPSRSDPAENCAAWIPKLTLSSQNDRVTVTITPVNPFASELELALHYRASSLQINPVRISARKETYTFINVSKGIYRVSLRAHGPHCSNLDYIFSRSLVSVTGEENSSRSKRHKECKNWRPTIDLSASGRSVTARYSPANHLASSLEIVLQRPGSSLVLYAKNISNSVTTYTFTDVDEGNYRMAILALGNKCRGADYIFSKQSVIVKDNVQGPICSEWKPSTFLARVIQESGSWCVVEVNLNIPSYLSAKKVEVGLQEPQSEEIVKLHSLRLAETSAVFNITKGKNNYKVVVRPYGCTDCKDFQDHGEECFLPFNTANSAMSCGNASWPLSNAGTSPVSTPPTTTSMTTTKTTTTTNRETRNNQTQTRENRNLTTTPRLTERDPPGSNTRPLTPSKLEHNPSTRYIQLVRVLLYLGGVAVLIVAVAATVMWLLGKRRQRRAVDRPGNAEAAPEMEQLRTSDDVDTEPKVPFSNSPDPNPPPNNYLLEYEINNRTEPKLPHYFPTQRSFSSRVLVIHECRKPSDKDVLDRFLDVIKKCLPHKNVRVDFECRRENARNVEEWARGELRCCTRVIVVLSKSFLEVCRSYEGSKTGQLTSPSAYSDIAPMVLRWILNGEGFEHLSIVFVYFEFDEIEARKVYRDLLGLYPSAQNCRLKMQRSSILDSGQPASIPVHCQGRGCEESCLDTRVARFRSLNNGNPVSACRSDDGFQRRDHSQAQCAQHFPCSVVQSSTGIGSNDHAACLEADHCYEDHSCQDASIPHTSPPPYSTIDPNVNAVANCGVPATLVCQKMAVFIIHSIRVLARLLQRRQLPRHVLPSQGQKQCHHVRHLQSLNQVCLPSHTKEPVQETASSAVLLFLQAVESFTVSLHVMGFPLASVQCQPPLMKVPYLCGRVMG
ncbi:hypothetical protein ACOMHN_049339 [Nucella lapillus]